MVFCKGCQCQHSDTLEEAVLPVKVERDFGSRPEVTINEDCISLRLNLRILNLGGIECRIL